MTALPPFGDAVPLGDPAWYQGLNTPFYKPTHAAWRKYVRDYCEEVLEPVLDDWEQCAVKGNLANATSTCIRPTRKAESGEFWPVPWASLGPRITRTAQHRRITTTSTSSS